MSETRFRDTTEDGARVVRYAGNGSVKWRGDCQQCVRYSKDGRGFFPDHDALRGCRSGGHSHCTCDGCF